MHRYSRKWRVQKQVMLEKLGAETNTLEIPEMVELYGITKSNEAALNEIQHRAERAHKAGFSHVESLNRLSDSLTAFVKLTKETSQEHGDVASSLFEFSALVKKAASLQGELCRVLDSGLAQPLKGFVQREIKAAKEAKKKYDGTRAAYQSVLNELQAVQGEKKTNFKKLAEVEARKDAAAEQFKLVSNEALGVLSETHKLTAVRGLHACASAWRAFSSFFEQGNASSLQSSQGLERATLLAPAIQRDYEAMRASRAQSGRPVLSQGLKQRSTVVFGVPLEEVAEREGSEVPRFVTSTAEWIWKHCRRTEGVFRISPMAESLRTLKASIDKGMPPQFLANDPHVACGILKQFLRDLPEPLMTAHLYPQFLEASKQHLDSPLADRITALSACLQLLPPTNRATLAVVLRLLHRLSWGEAATKMGATNLATVVAPNILYTDGVDPFLMVEAMGDANACVTLLVQEFPAFFPEVDLFPLVRYGMLEKLRSALGSAVPEPHALDRCGDSLLHAAARARAQPEIVALLLEQQGVAVDLAREEDGVTPLMLAIADTPEALRVARCLLENGASLDVQNAAKQSARDMAAQLGPAYLQRLLSNSNATLSNHDNVIVSNDNSNDNMNTNVSEMNGSSYPTTSSSSGEQQQQQQQQQQQPQDAQAGANPTWKRNRMSIIIQSPIMGVRGSIPPSPRREEPAAVVPPVAAEAPDVTPTTPSLPDTSHSIPDNAISTPDNTHSIPDNTHSILDNTHSIPDTSNSIPDTSTSTSTSPSTSTSTSTSIPDTSHSTSTPSTTTSPSAPAVSEVLPISESDLDQYFAGFSIPPLLSQTTALDQLVGAAFSFASECAKDLGAITGSSPVYLAVKHLGVQYQKTAGPSGLLFPAADQVREASEANHQSILQCGNSIPPTITKVISGLGALSKSGDPAAKRAVAEALQKFLEPLIMLLAVFEKCTSGEVLRGQKVLLDALQALLSLLADPATPAACPAVAACAETLARTATLLAHLIRRKALNLPSDGHPQFLLFQSCAALESLFGELLHDALAQAREQPAARDPAQARLKQASRGVILELTQIYAVLNASYPERAFRFVAHAAALYRDDRAIVDRLRAEFSLSSQQELAPYVPLLARISASLGPLGEAGDLTAEPVVQLVEACDGLIAETRAQIRTTISTALRELDDSVLNRHFDLFLDSAAYHQLNLQLSAAYHLAILIATPDPQSLHEQVIPPMSLPHALFYFLTAFSDFSRTLITVFNIDE